MELGLLTAKNSLEQRRILGGVLSLAFCIRPDKCKLKNKQENMFVCVECGPKSDTLFTQYSDGIKKLDLCVSFEGKGNNFNDLCEAIANG